MENNYVAQMRASKDKAQSAYHEFTLSTKKFEDSLFCFFEGKDNAYYVPRIKKHNQEIYSILCGGRDHVLGVHSLIRNHRVYDKYKKAYFIDRDFNHEVGVLSPPVYETPCYAVENLYTSLEVFRQILQHEFHLSGTSDSDFKICEVRYAKLQEEFHSAVLLFNAWYSCLIDIRNSKGHQTGVQLDEKFPKNFIEVTLDKVVMQYDINKIRETFSSAIEITQDELDKRINDFNRNPNKGFIFRGKYEMQFLIKVIQLMLQDSDRDKKLVQNKISFAFGDGSGLNNLQAINIFSAYALTPQVLDDYLVSLAN